MSPKRIIILIGIAILLLVAWLSLAPPRIWLNTTKAVEPTAAVGAQLVEQYECRSCHKIAGEGALKAPSLDGITLRSDDPVQVTLRLWLRDPRAVKGDTAMPNFRLSDSEIEALLAYLSEVDASQ
jgi:mono/diheme cytochrome c family protein